MSINNIELSIQVLRTDILQLDNFFKENIQNIITLNSIEKDNILNKIVSFVLEFDYIIAQPKSDTKYFNTLYNIYIFLIFLEKIFKNDIFREVNKHQNSRLILFNQIQNIKTKIETDKNTKFVIEQAQEKKTFNYGQIYDTHFDEIYRISDLLKLYVKNFVDITNNYTLPNLSVENQSKLKYLVNLFQIEINNINTSENYLDKINYASAIFSNIIKILDPSFNFNNVFNNNVSVSSNDIILSLFQIECLYIYNSFYYFELYLLMSLLEFNTMNNPDFMIEKFYLYDLSYNKNNKNSKDFIDNLNLFQVYEINCYENIYIGKTFNQVVNNYNYVNFFCICIFEVDSILETDTIKKINDKYYSCEIIETNSNLIKLRYASEKETQHLYLTKQYISVSKITSNLQSETKSFLLTESYNNLADFLGLDKISNENISIFKKFIFEDITFNVL